MTSQESSRTESVQSLRTLFRERFGSEARIFRAPGRVNLIGEHTDYNDGFVLPAAIDRYVWVAIGSRRDAKLVVESLNFSQTVEIDLANANARSQGNWSDYAQGIVLMLLGAGYPLRGANLMVWGNVPIGSGLSSSAAIEVALGYALLENAGIALGRAELAKLCQKAENEFVGAHVGVMDQFISCFGRSGQGLLLDCRSLEFRLLPLPREVSLVICNTMVKHEHAGGEYNQRRRECEEGVKVLSRALPQVHALRDVTLVELEQHSSALPRTIFKRCRHVISENARVQQSAVALGQGNLPEFGRLMYGSHQSLRDDYEVSCTELDLVVELARKQPGVYGARMTGGGFGGCTINLLRQEDAPQFQSTVVQEYESVTGLHPQIFITTPAEGAGEVRG